MIQLANVEAGGKEIQWQVLNQPSRNLSILCWLKGLLTNPCAVVSQE